MPQLPVFDLTARRDLALTLVVGRRESGKTALVQRLLQEGASMEGVLVDRTNASGERLRAFIEGRREAVRRGANGDGEIPRHLYRRLVVDDLSASMLKRPGFLAALEDVAANHRHYGLDVVLVAQSFTSVPPTVRALVNYVAITSCLGEGEVRHIHDTYVGDDACSFDTFLSVAGPGLWVNDTSPNSLSLLCQLHDQRLRSAL